MTFTKNIVFCFLLGYTGSFLLPYYKFNSEAIQQNCIDIPEPNKKIIEYVNTKIKKKVGRGECWDLAAEALKLVNAEWDGQYVYGREVNYQTECVFPGDIMQFEGVKIQYTKDGATFKEKMAHHTAIIYEVKGKGDYLLAHQNTSFSGKKVGISPLNLAHIKKGKFKIYRPVTK